MAIHVINLPDFLRRQFHPLNPPPTGDRLATHPLQLSCPCGVDLGVFPVLPCFNETYSSINPWQRCFAPITQKVTKNRECSSFKILIHLSIATISMLLSRMVLNSCFALL
ncbi:hypothetical protein KsCSTR_43660 [Candidatus Kuenenia stuttgartiensis]|uniref:Uncharacterized protein n=1 Tax=Kuenenia stuttgartiensis TaxID=174633 RepID=Q1PX14_KUEST|nr:hypothetical protein KsCSTR_43660 [Candidatus Kuenenia stuttgartiensis]TVM02258.1 MAG: hypothetical protein CV080_01440 [Candidatus Kuenenia stuttgartiensis]CAJ71768.1 unknown protein [Candidatus Kuenenia stuttgartiensis]